MRFQQLICFSLVVILLTNKKSTAQTVNFSAQEDKFIKLYSKLESFARGDVDSLNLYSEKFETEFTGFIKNNPATLNYPFKKLSDSIFSGVKT